MNSYTLALYALLLATLAQSGASWLCVQRFLCRDAPRLHRHAWLAFAFSAILLALLHGHSLELALRTGLYDLRQALLGTLIAVFFALGSFGLSRR